MTGATDRVWHRVGGAVALTLALTAMAACTTPGDIADDVAEQMEKERDRQNAERAHDEGMGSLEDRR